jgi:hypothetical protein
MDIGKVIEIGDRPFEVVRKPVEPVREPVHKEPVHKESVPGKERENASIGRYWP